MNFVRSTPDGMKAIPPGFTIPLTIGVTKPVLRSVWLTNDAVGFAAVGVGNTLTAEYAESGAKYGVVIEYTAFSPLSATSNCPAGSVAKTVSSSCVSPIVVGSSVDVSGTTNAF